MLSIRQATDIVRRVYPQAIIEGPIRYQGLFIFQVFDGEPLEVLSDPFFSVDQETGELRDFSVLTDGDINEITRLFLINQREV